MIKGKKVDEWGGGRTTEPNKDSKVKKEPPFGIFMLKSQRLFAFVNNGKEAKGMVILLISV